MKFICTNFNTLSLNFANFSLFRQILTLNFLGFKLPQLITNLPQRVSRIRRYLTKILSEHNWGIKAGQRRKSIEIESRSLRSSLLGLVWQEVLARNFLYVISNILRSRSRSAGSGKSGSKSRSRSGSRSKSR